MKGRRGTLNYPDLLKSFLCTFDESNNLHPREYFHEYQNTFGDSSMEPNQISLVSKKRKRIEGKPKKEKNKFLGDKVYPIYPYKSMEDWIKNIKDKPSDY